MCISVCTSTSPTIWFMSEPPDQAGQGSVLVWFGFLGEFVQPLSKTININECLVRKMSNTSSPKHLSPCFAQPQLPRPKTPKIPERP